MNKPDYERIKETDLLKLLIHNLGGYERISQVKLAKQMKVSRSSVNAYFKRLRDGVILHPRTIYRLTQALNKLEGKNE